jgi:hypothetical protein
LPKGPPWRVVAGCVFGGMVLLTFLGFAIAAAAAGDSGVICDAALALTVSLALGTALAGAFIGGEIGVEGGLKHSVLGNVTYAAVGGIGSLIVTFLLMFGAYYQACPAADPFGRFLRLQILGVPTDTLAVAPNVWIQRQNTDLSVLMEQRPTATLQPLLRLRSERTGPDSPPECVIRITNNAGDANGGGPGAHRLSWTKSPKTVAISFDRAYGGRASTAECLEMLSSNPRRPLANNVDVDAYGIVVYDRAPDGGKCKLPGYGDQPCPLQEGIAVQGTGARPAVSQFAGIWGAIGIGSAMAEPDAFDDYVRDLLGADAKVVDAAKRQLIGDITLYRDQVFARLQASRTPSQERGALLDVLAEAISSVQPHLVPGSRIRELSQPITLFAAGDYQTITNLAADADATVRLKARRIIQRYPVNAFDPVLKASGGVLAKDCDTSDRTTYLRYSALYYYYNRVVDKIYTEDAVNVPLTDKQVSEVVTAYNDGQQAAACLPDDLRVDAALLDYGQALVKLNVDFDKKSGRGPVGDEATAFVNKFMVRLRTSLQNYIFPQHTVYMSLFSPNVQWKDISDASTATRDMVLGGASGLSSGTDFRASNPLLRGKMLDVRRYPAAGAARVGQIPLEAVSVVLAQANKSWFFIKYKSGAATSDFGWIEVPAVSS